jgi:hypothetical protein
LIIPKYITITEVKAVPADVTDEVISVAADVNANNVTNSIVKFIAVSCRVLMMFLFVLLIF